MRALIPMLLVLGLTACNDGEDDPNDDADTDTDTDVDMGVAVLGDEAHSMDAVNITVELDYDSGLRGPRDLAFNPERPRELWVLNRLSDTTTRLYEAGTTAQWSDTVKDPYALHFQEEASSIDFGQPGTFGTCQESRNTYNGQGSPNDFMGPTLWPSDLDLYAESNPAAVEYLTDLFGYYTDLGSHLDMLHESPLCMGIAWETENRYWVFDGKNSAISMNDFKEDHGPGYDDHTDGHVIRYAEGEVSRVADVPGHMVYDHATDIVYVADTGNNRIAALDTTSGTTGSNLASAERYPVHRRQDDADLWTAIDGDAFGMEEPSGLLLHDGILFVGDHGTNTIHAFNMATVEAGDPVQVDWLQLDTTELMGLEIGPDGNLWVIDYYNQVLKISPKE